MSSRIALALMAATVACVPVQVASAGTSGSDLKVARDSWGRVAGTMPRRYVDYPAYFALVAPALQAERNADLAFARASGTLERAEGPWGPVPVLNVIYFGVDKGGKRVALTKIPQPWRYKPSQIGLGDKLMWIFGRPSDGGPLIQAIRLGLDDHGLLVRAPDDSPDDLAPASGLIDGKDLYFSEDGDRWSLSIGGEDAVAAPVWYHEEPCGELDCSSDTAAYALIEKGARLYRDGIPSMARSG